MLVNTYQDSSRTRGLQSRIRDVETAQGMLAPKTMLECHQQADLKSQRGLQATLDQPTPLAQYVATGNAG